MRNMGLPYIFEWFVDPVLRRAFIYENKRKKKGGDEVKFGFLLLGRSRKKTQTQTGGLVQNGNAGRHWSPSVGE